MAVRRGLEKAWFSLLLFGFICIGVFRVFQDPTRVAKGRLDRQLKGVNNEEWKHVTKSLNVIEGSVSEHVLLFNRVPKAGSEMLVLLLQWLQGVNGFRHTRLPGGENRRLTLEQQEELVKEVVKVTRSEAVPVSFDRHVYFVNFTKFNQQTPIYLNLVRDPVDKAVSRFYYGRVTPNPNNPDLRRAIRRTTKQPKISVGNFEDCVRSDNDECSYRSGDLYDLTIPYFCGHEKQCMVLNDQWALQRAKKNVEKFYPVVGVLEELNATLAVLESRLPLFFKGVQTMYFNELLSPHKNANRTRPRSIDLFVRSHLKKKLSTEYDFYYWLKSRILRQRRTLGT